MVRCGVSGAGVTTAACNVLGGGCVYIYLCRSMCVDELIVSRYLVSVFVFGVYTIKALF